MAQTILIARSQTSFSSLKQARDKSKFERVYRFDFNGIKFRSFVDVDGWVLVASSLPIARVNPLKTAASRPLSKESGLILNEQVLANVPDLSELKISTRDEQDLLIITSDAEILQRARSYKSLTRRTGDDKKWNVVTAKYSLTINGTHPEESLLNSIYWCYRNGNGLHFVKGYSALKYYEKIAINLNLWMR